MTMTTPGDQLRTEAQVAERLNLPPRTLGQWRYLGRGPRFIRCGRHVRYRDVDVEIWLAEHTADPRDAA